MSITIIVPAYNEEKRIGRMLDDYLGFFGDEVQFLIVINGCVDDTLGVVKQYKEQYPDRITYIDYKESGKGRAVRKGWELADDEWIGLADADDVTQAQEFAKMIRACKDDPSVDGAIASRYAPGARVQDRVSALRRLASHIYKFIVKILFWLPYHDTQCGAKLFKRKVIKTIIPHMRDNTMAADVEVLLLCRKFNFKLVEVPTVWYEMEVSATMPTKWHVVRMSLKMLRALLQLRWRFIKE